MPTEEYVQKIVILPNEVEEAVRVYFKLKEGAQLRFDIRMEYPKDSVPGDYDDKEPVFKGIVATRTTSGDNSILLG